MKHLALAVTLGVAAPALATPIILDDPNPALGHTASAEPALHNSAAEKLFIDDDEDIIKRALTDLDAPRFAIPPPQAVADMTQWEGASARLDDPIDIPPPAHDPVPEPRSAALLIGALIGFWLVRRSPSARLPSAWPRRPAPST